MNAVAEMFCKIKKRPLNYHLWQELGGVITKLALRHAINVALISKKNYYLLNSISYHPYLVTLFVYSVSRDVCTGK